MLPFTVGMPLYDRDRAQVVTQQVKGKAMQNMQVSCASISTAVACQHQALLAVCCGDGCLSAAWSHRASSDLCAFLSPCS